MYKIYAYIKFQLTAPLAIGGMTASETDKDVLKNAKGEPFIPATALAGVYRSLFSDSEANRYFGFMDKVDRANQSTEAKESSVVVYDGRLCGDTPDYHVGIRNGVGLDRFKTAIEGAKFDFEVVEPGSVFWTALEYTSETSRNGEPDTYVIDRILSAWTEGTVIVGGKSTRGMGRFRVLEKKTISFCLPEQADQWINFDLYADSTSNGSGMEKKGWSDWNESRYRSVGEKRCRITLTLKQEGPVTVRVYSTEVARKKEGESAPLAAADYKQLAYTERNGQEETEVAVIPGTSWAGVFRHNMARYLGQDWEKAQTDLEELFGKVNKVKSTDAADSAARSKILFSETYLRNGSFKLVSRNAIDRFSGGTADTALFTEKMYYGGEGGKLEITVPVSIDDRFLKVLAASIADLHEGFLAVGGSVSVGHGVFSVTSLDMEGATLQDDISGENIYRFILEHRPAANKPETEESDSEVAEFISTVRGLFNNRANAVLIYNDAFEVISVRELLSEEFDLKNAQDKLLDIRVFDRDKEVRIWRDYAQNVFSELIELSDDKMQEFDTYEDEQYLDKAAVSGDEGLIRSTGGGNYRFPEEEKGKTQIKIKNYVAYDENGQAYLAAWRLVEFI